MKAANVVKAIEMKNEKWLKMKTKENIEIIAKAK